MSYHLRMLYNSFFFLHNYIIYLFVYLLRFQSSKNGLFIDMKSFKAFGKDYVLWNYEKTGNSIYLRILKKLKEKSMVEGEPKVLGIGLLFCLCFCCSKLFHSPKHFFLFCNFFYSSVFF